MHFVDEQECRLRGRLHLVDHLAQALLELALDAGTGLQQANIQRQHAGPEERFGHVTGDNSLGKALDHSGFSNARLTGQQWVVLTPTHQNVDELTHLLIAPQHRVEVAKPCLLGKVAGVALQGAGSFTELVRWCPVTGYHGLFR